MAKRYSRATMIQGHVLVCHQCQPSLIWSFEGSVNYPDTLVLEAKTAGRRASQALKVGTYHIITLLPFPGYNMLYSLCFYMFTS